MLIIVDDVKRDMLNTPLILLIARLAGSAIKPLSHRARCFACQHASTQTKFRLLNYLTRVDAAILGNSIRRHRLYGNYVEQA